MVHFYYRNLSFDTDEDTLTEELSQFGGINYCKVVVDRNTERSKGNHWTWYHLQLLHCVVLFCHHCYCIVVSKLNVCPGMAFVQFASKQDADQCLAASDAEVSILVLLRCVSVSELV